MAHPSPQSDMADPTDEAISSNLGQTIADIVRREGVHELVAEKLLCIQTADGQAFGYKTDDWYLLNYMPQLQGLYASLIASDEPPVDAVFDQWTKRPGFKLTKLGKRVLLACMYFAHREEEGRDWQQVYAYHQFHPVIAVTLRAVMRWWSPICRWKEPTRFLIEGEPDTAAVDGLRHLVEFVRRGSVLSTRCEGLGVQRGGEQGRDQLPA